MKIRKEIRIGIIGIIALTMLFFGLNFLKGINIGLEIRNLLVIIILHLLNGRCPVFLNIIELLICRILKILHLDRFPDR